MLTGLARTTDRTAGSNEAILRNVVMRLSRPSWPVRALSGSTLRMRVRRGQLRRRRARDVDSGALLSMSSTARSATPCVAGLP